MAKKIYKQIFLGDLPTKNKRGKELYIYWEGSIGYKVRFIYDDIEGEIEIIDYQIKKKMLTILYKGKRHDISKNSFSQCQLGRILGRHTKDFKIEIGKTFKDEKRDVTIIDKEYRPYERVTKSGNITIQYLKWYKYHCNIDGHEDWILESHLEHGIGCSCCSRSKTIKGTNDIATTHPHLVKYFKNIEDAYTHTYGSHEKAWMVCPDCGHEKYMVIYDLYRTGISCEKCSDNISYPEKFMFSILDQLEIDFITQLNKSDFKWIGEYKYDFYFTLNNEPYIIETHGEQHYKDSKWTKVEDVQANDELKKDLALNNGIKEDNYIVIDCRYSILKWIKQNILVSNMKSLFNFNIIDWSRCFEFAVSNRVREACDLFNNGISIKEISNITKLRSLTTIRKYLKQGAELGWCNYIVKEKNTTNNFNPLVIEVIRAVDNQSLGVFKSMQDLAGKSENILGVKLSRSTVKRRIEDEEEWNGYIFKYVPNKEPTM